MTTAEATTLLVDALQQLSAARADRAIYRVIAQQALHLVHEQQVEVRQLREAHERLCVEYRHFREQAMRASSERAA